MSTQIQIEEQMEEMKKLHKLVKKYVKGAWKVLIVDEDVTFGEIHIYRIDIEGGKKKYTINNVTDAFEAGRYVAMFECCYMYNVKFIHNGYYVRARELDDVLVIRVDDDFTTKYIIYFATEN